MTAPLPRSLTPVQHQRLTAARRYAEAGLSAHQAADRIGISRAALLATLQATIDCGAWPPEFPAGLFDLPVAARAPWTRASEQTHGAALRAHRRSLSQQRADDRSSGARLDDHTIAERREAVATARAEREQQLLAAERTRYGLTRQTRTRPLSRMPA